MCVCVEAMILFDLTLKIPFTCNTFSHFSSKQKGLFVLPADKKKYYFKSSSINDSYSNSLLYHSCTVGTEAVRRIRTVNCTFVA